jgi:hypothetical protein
VKIVDLSADYRIKDVATYEKWYGIEHKSPQFIEEAVYGLCEINRDKITEKTRLVANPGCYTTCSILTAYPMVKEGMIDVNTLIVDAKRLTLLKMKGEARIAGSGQHRRCASPLSFWNRKHSSNLRSGENNIWNSLISLLPFCRLSLWLLAQVLAFGALSI